MLCPPSNRRFVPEPDLTERTYSARLKTASSVTSFTNGLVNFNSLSVSEVMLRFSEGLPVRFAKCWHEYRD
jgi:hypothetical protein